MKGQMKKRVFPAVILALSLVVGLASGALAAEPRAGKIVLDGEAGDWDLAGLELLSVDSSEDGNAFDLYGWRVARDEENIYLCVEGVANKWAFAPGKAELTLTQNGESLKTSIHNIKEYRTEVGLTYEYVCQANENGMGPFVVEAAIPTSYFTDPNFVISLFSTSMPAAAIPTLNGEEIPKEEETAVYEGIVMDGTFEDWAAVSRCPGNDPNGTIENVSMVFDGEDVFIYIKETEEMSATAAGPQSNGKYAIVTDLGNTQLFELTREEDLIRGVEGVEAKHMGREWEIRIPKSELPLYKETISFGIYLEEPMVSDVANLDGSAGNAPEESGDIVIDGQYSDWDAYPHHSVQYAGQGTGEMKEDASGAIHVAGGKIYSHAETTMPQHLGAQGGEFLAAVSVAFNGNRDWNDILGLVMTPEGGGDIVNEGTRLEPGIHTFDIYDLKSLGDPARPKLGTMKVTINGYCDEMELELDMEAVAEYLHLTEEEMKTVEIQYGRLGQLWIAASGTSSGPWLWLLVILPGCAAIWYAMNRKKGKEALE